MPELPEVITVISALSHVGIVGDRIVDARVTWERSVGGDPGWFHDQVIGRRIESVSYRGKHIVSSLTTNGANNALVAHLRMSGRIYVRPIPSDGDAGPLPYERVVLRLDTDRLLCFYDPRKFGRLIVTDTPDQDLHHLGEDPLSPSFQPTTLHEIVHSRRRRLKTLLLDQRIIAGLGNIYTDEALWIAAIHPLRMSSSLSGDETKRLWAAVRFVLEEGIANHGTQLGGGKSDFVPFWQTDTAGTGGRDTILPPRNQYNLRVFQRVGKPCPRCNTPISRIVVAQRGTHMCPRCQTV